MTIGSFAGVASGAAFTFLPLPALGRLPLPQGGAGS